MNLGTILWFQFGEAKAICETADCRSAAGVGVVLVFTAAIARSYDREVYPRITVDHRAAGGVAALGKALATLGVSLTETP